MAGQGPTIGGTIFAANNTSIKELIGETSVEQLRSLDGTFSEMFLTEINQAPAATTLGRDLRHHTEYYGSLAGVIRGGNLNAYEGLYGPQASTIASTVATMGPGSAAPRAQDGANALPYGLTTRLYNFDTNLMIPLILMEMDALPANIKKHVIPLLMGFAKNVALFMATGFFANSTNNYRLTALPASGSDVTIDGTNRKITFVVPESSSIFKLEIGQAVDVWTSGNVRLNQETTGDTTAYGSEKDRVPCFVVDKDPWTNKVTLACASTSAEGGTFVFGTNFTSGNLAGGFVTHANTYNTANPNGATLAAGFAGFYNWRDWAKWGASTDAAADRRILGANAITDTTNDYIDVSERGQFKSGRFANVGTLTETNFSAQLSRAHAVFDPLGYSIDFILAAEGIILAVFDQMLAQQRMQVSRTGQVASMTNMGQTGEYTITVEGRNYSLKTSRFLERNTMVGMRRSGNWTMLVPPSATGTQRGAIPNVPDKLPLDFWAGAVSGSNSPRIEMRNTDGQLVPASEMPAKCRMNIQPMKQIPMVVWENVNDVYTLASS